MQAMLEALEQWLVDIEDSPTIFNYGPMGFVPVSIDRWRELQSEGLSREQAYVVAVMEHAEAIA